MGDAKGNTRPKGKPNGGKSPDAGGTQMPHGGGYHNSHQTGDALMALYPRGARGPARVTPVKPSVKTPDFSDGSSKPRRRDRGNMNTLLSKFPRRWEHDAA